MPLREYGGWIIDDTTDKMICVVKAEQATIVVEWYNKLEQEVARLTTEHESYMKRVEELTAERDRLQHRLQVARRGHVNLPKLHHFVRTTRQHQGGERVMDFPELIDEITAEADQGYEKNGLMSSPHEGLAVLWEEFIELRDAVFLNHSNPDRMKQIHGEAIQVAAVALRIAYEFQEASEQ